MNEKIKKCFVLGAGGQCRVVLSILNQYQESFDVVGILENDNPKHDERILGVSILGDLNELTNLYTNDCQTAFIAIGDNTKRQYFYNILSKDNFKLPNLIAPNAFIDPSVKMGNANIICYFAHLGPEVKIGSNNIINTAAIIEHESAVMDHSHISPKAVVCGRSQIGSYVFLGAGVTVIDKIRIASKQVIGAGSVVTKDLNSPIGTYAGVPARLIH